MKKIVWSILCCLGCFCVSANAYFESRYWCVIEESTIQVSLTTGEQLCFDYMAGLAKLIQQTTTDIKSASDNASITKWYDHDYRIGIVNDQTKKKESLTDLQQKIVLSMKDFEKELFLRIKGIVWYYLLKHTGTLEEKVVQGKALLLRLILIWNKDQYGFVRKQIDGRERELIFLDSVKQSYDFATLIPPLKQWMEIYY